MSRRRLLSLFCLSIALLSLVQLTRAGGALRVNEKATRVLLGKEPAEVVLAIENSTGETLNAKVEVELLAPNNETKAQAKQASAIGRGNNDLSLPLKLSFSDFKGQERKQLLWYRLHYRVLTADSNNTLIDGIISLSEITPDLFEIKLVATDFAREGRQYRARVQATHPYYSEPSANVRVDAELTLEQDEANIKLRTSKNTDANGVAYLDFALPQRFPQFPHTLRPSGGEIKVVAKRGAVVSEVSTDVLVDQFSKVLISTDKPLYQPGQLMHVRALAFSPGKHALADQNMVIKIQDPEDIGVYSTTVKTSRFGIVSADWPIPESARLGDYRIRVGLEGDEDDAMHYYNVRISRYDLPNFSVSVEPDRRFYLPGQNARVKVRADYLFGQPLTQGQVRVVRESGREWNYREQKWDVEEGEKYEGKTDANGVFVADINLGEMHQSLADDDYDRFDDVTFAAYFTDPSTNRTEQRRFDLRVTRDAIHVYVLERGYYAPQHPRLPIEFHVSTFYADGTPASCNVRPSIVHEDYRGKRTIRPLSQVQTNRYGLAKVSAVRWSQGLDPEEEVKLTVSAFDSKGRGGWRTERVRVSAEPTVRVRTDKTIYRTGEPINAVITSTAPNETLNVDLVQDAGVIRSQRVRLRGGRASIAFPYKPDMKKQLTIAAYPDSFESSDMSGSQMVIYPQPSELKVDLQTSQQSYRPGEDARIDLNVRAPGGEVAESALGLVVFDKAVEERFRSDQEFGGELSDFYRSLQGFLGLDDQIAGVTLRDLQRLDLSKPVSPELELLADILLNRNRDYTPSFVGSDQYDDDQIKFFEPPIRTQLAPLVKSLTARYLSTSEYPRDVADLRRFLLASQIDLDSLRDPWGTRYRPAFSIDRESHVFKLMTAGPDKRFDTSDDFSAKQLRWPYFTSTGVTLNNAIRRYHERTGGYIRDLPTLSAELLNSGVNLETLRDRWGEAYRFEFDIHESNYLIKVTSGGPNKRFSREGEYVTDDFLVWTSAIDYFAESRAEIDAALTRHFESIKQFPQNDLELSEALPDKSPLIETLRDPWGQPYYRTFKSQTLPAPNALAENPATPSATRMVAYVSLRSVGPDGKAGTADDFPVAIFSAVQPGQGKTEPRETTAGVVLSDTHGSIYGAVTDPQGAVVAGTKIILTRGLDGHRYQTSSNDDGRYSFGVLLPGIYELSFEALGFKKHLFTNVWVRAANLTEIDARLEVGQVSEAVSVTAGKSPLDEFTARSRPAFLPGRGRVTLITKSGSAASTPRLREYFPETLLWQPSIETDARGRAKIDFKLADNITTWKLAVVASTEDGRIGTVEKEIKAFQPFFVEHEPPRVLTEGDEISLPVVVRNYLAQSQNVDLEIKPEKWFALLSPARKRMSVVAGDAKRETFDFRAVSSVKDGKQRITAQGADDNDAIEKPVSVHPDGEEISVTAGDIFVDSASLELNLPENTIPGSSRAELKIYPNLMAHVVESVEAIMLRPYGCAEQTISSTYPSLLLVRHHKRTGQDFPLSARAQRYLETGYSRLLNYRDESGGFSYWGYGDPDVALTVYALRFLTEATDLIAVDEKVIEGAREWLVKQQQKDGSWPAKYGYDPKDDSHDLMLSAYVTRTLVMSEKGSSSPEVKAALKLALDFLNQRALEFDEPYLLATFILAVTDLQEPQRATAAVAKLRSSAKVQNGVAFWELKTSTPFHGWGRPGDVETTALVLQALNRYCASGAASCESESKLISGAMRFLLKQKDHYGVWYSTQATINVLDSMLTMLSTQSNSAAESTAEIVVNGRVVQTIQIPNANRLLNPIMFDLSQFVHVGKNTVEIKRPSGASSASVQALLHYYVPWSAANHAEQRASDLRLVAKFDKTEARISDTITCHVEAQRASSGFGMMLAEIGLPPGADVDRSSLDKAMQESGWVFSQYDVLPDRVVVYLWPRAGAIKFDFTFRPRFGLNAKSAPSIIYDYYNPDSRATLAPVKFRVQ